MSIFNEPARRPISSTDTRYYDALADVYGVDYVAPAFLHVTVAQCGMPLKEQPSDRPYVRYNGRASLALTAGVLMNPETEKFELQGLPYGPLARLLMIDICTKSVLTKSPIVDMNDCQTRYLEDDLGIVSRGGVRGSIRSFQRQMKRLAATHLTLGMVVDSRAITLNPTPAIAKYSLWHPDSLDERKYMGEVTLSDEFFVSLLEHALPLDPRAIRGLRSSAMGLDLNFFLTHRLCRISRGKTVTLEWSRVHTHFAPDMIDPWAFRAFFKKTLKRVVGFYPEANVEVSGEGIHLRYSPSPVRQRALPFSTK
jgi:hypothetical protein